VCVERLVNSCANRCLDHSLPDCVLKHPPPQVVLEGEGMRGEITFWQCCNRRHQNEFFQVTYLGCQSWLKLDRAYNCTINGERSPKEVCSLRSNQFKSLPQMNAYITVTNKNSTAICEALIFENSNVTLHASKTIIYT